MTGHRVLPGVDARLRIVPWRGDLSTAYLTPARGRPDAHAVAKAVAALSDRGYRSALTTALAPPDQRAFLEAGFDVHERLHLLVRPLRDIPPAGAPPCRIRRGHHADRAAVLAVDHAAFPAFWRLDDPGLRDAQSATPSARLRVAQAAPDARITGYTVIGRAGARGYLQRLAVDPAWQRRGIGRALVVDGLRWLRRWGAKEVLVNTQEANSSAVRLYEQLGFRLQPEGLAVLRWVLDGAS